MKNLEEIYELCSQTGAWYGIKILNFDQRNFMGDTVLHTVCGWGELPPVKALVGAGADLNARGDCGATPLFNAVMGESAEVVSYLLSTGADARILNDDQRNVLQYAKNVSKQRSIHDLLTLALGRK